MSSVRNLAPGSISLRAAHPVVIDPILAKDIGLNEAVILQQIRYWAENPKVGREVDGQRWIHNTYEEWQENFPFWSIATIRRAIASLEEMDLISVRQDLGEFSRDRTKWYTINRKHPAYSPEIRGECADACAQNEQFQQRKMSSSNSSKCADVNKNRDYTETTTESNSRARASRRTKMTPYPDDFSVTESMYEWALEKKGLTSVAVDLETEQFTNHHLAKGTRFVDWERAWMTWMGNASKWGKERSGGRAGAGTGSRAEDPDRRNWDSSKWFED